MQSKFDRHQYFSQYLNGEFIPDPLLNQIDTNFVNPASDTYLVTDEDLRDPSLISWKAYRSERLWWLILMVNDILDPFKDLAVGTSLKIPDRDEVLSLVNSLKKRK